MHTQNETAGYHGSEASNLVTHWLSSDDLSLSAVTRSNESSCVTITYSDI